MADLRSAVPTVLEWHSAEEIPALHPVEYAGESWLQSQRLLLINAAGKMAIGYCQQCEDGHPRFEVEVSSNTLDDIARWAIVQLPSGL